MADDEHLVLPAGDGGAVSSEESTTAVPSDDVTAEVSSPPVVDSSSVVIVSPDSSGVGWPPIRRRSLRLASRTKALEKQSSSTSEPPNKTLNNNVCSDESQVGNNYQLVKVKMDGMLVGRKVNLCAHNSFESLAQELQDMFFENGSSNMLDAKSEYVLTYEDKDGGRMLAGDVPWCEVGWPPIRRKSLRLASQTKALEKQSSSTSEPPNKTLNNNVCSDESQVGNNYQLVKVKMDGMLIGRKVNLCVHNSFESLAQALQNMFFENEAAGSLNMLDAKPEYVLTYEDKDGGRMLAGDVPWWMFLSSVKRLQIVRNFEGVVARKRAIESPTCPEKRTYMKK